MHQTFTLGLTSRKEKLTDNYSRSRSCCLALLRPVGPEEYNNDKQYKRSEADMENQPDESKFSDLEREDTGMAVPDLPAEPADTPSLPPEPDPEPVMSAPAPTPVKRHRFVQVLIAILVVALVGAGCFAAYKMYFEPKQETAAPSQQDTANTADTTSEANAALSATAQSDKIVDIMAHVRSLIAAKQFTVADSTDVGAPHRKMPAPYDFYADATNKDIWRVAVATVADTSQATAFTKQIYDYLMKAQGAKAETLFGDAAVATLGEEGTNRYRISTDAYTCGLFEDAAYAATAPYDRSGAEISLACSTVDEYEKNAAIQQPFYRAILTAEGYSADKTMLKMPLITDSATAGYKRADVSIGSDSGIGGAVGLFYYTPGGTWRFFRGTQEAITCEAFTTADLKKAFVGYPCAMADHKAGSVSL